MTNASVAVSLTGATLLILFSTGCSSSSVRAYEQDEVLATVDGKSQPWWATETKPFSIEDGDVSSVGVARINGDDRPEMGAVIAENGARANIAKAIEARMEFAFHSEEGLSYDQGAVKFIAAEASSLTTSVLRNGGMWWVRYAQSAEDGSRKIRYKIYSLVTMPEADFKRAIHQAIEKATQEKKLSPGFQKQVDEHWDKFVNAAPNGPIAGDAQ